MKTVRLPYAEQGDPDGTPVLFLHGITDSQRSWEPVLPLLPESIRAIAVIQVDHGDDLVLRCWNVREEATVGRWRFARPVARARLVRADER